MANVKQSYISNLIGEDSYEKYSRLALKIVVIGSIVMAVLFTLSHFYHSGIINYLLKLTTGTSLLFIAYIAVCILVLDIRVEVEKPEQQWGGTKKESPKPLKYILTIVWGVILLVLGIVAIYYSNRYRNHYSFECETFMVDEKDGIYHLDWNDDCSVAEKAESLDEMQGYQMDKTFEFCEECQDLLEDVGP